MSYDLNWQVIYMIVIWIWKIYGGNFQTLGKLRPFFEPIGGVFIKNNSYKNVKDWFPIKSIKNNLIYTKDGKCVKIFKIAPINFKLKSDVEQMVILETYKQLLKLCNFNMQIIVQTDNVDLEAHFSKIDNFKNPNIELSEMTEDYKNLIKKIAKERESISRKFYLVVPSEVRNVEDKITNGFLNCGNSVEKCSREEIIKMLKRYFKKNSGARKETKWV